MAKSEELITIDHEADAAYIRFSRRVSVATEVLNDFINVDLDSSPQVVGIELLSLDEKVPFDQLAVEYNLPSDLVATLKEHWLAK
jgi:uncharacterized protein YuzE